MIKQRNLPRYRNPFGENPFIWGDRVMLPADAFSTQNLPRKKMGLDANQISVVSYNVMAQGRSKTVAYCQAQHLLWPSRQARLYREIADFDADIVALQDVDNYDLWWREMLSMLGYDSIYKLRTSELVSRTEGLVVAWRRTKFQLVATMEINFNDITCEGRLSAQIKQDNVAQIIALQPFEESAHPSGVVVLNTELCQDPTREDVRLAQVRTLTRTIEAFNSDYHFPILACGTFHSNPAGQAYGVMANGRVPLDPTVPTKPGQPSVEIDSLSSVRITWQPSEIDHRALSPYLEGHIIQWRPGGNRFLGFNEQKFVLDEDAVVYTHLNGQTIREKYRSILITGLCSGIPYEFRICGVNAAGWSEWSELTIPVLTKAVPLSEFDSKVLLKEEQLQLLQAKAKIKRDEEQAKRDASLFDRSDLALIPGFVESLQVDQHPWISLSGVTPRFENGQLNREVTPVRTFPKSSVEKSSKNGIGTAEDEAISDNASAASYYKSYTEIAAPDVTGERDALQEHYLNLRSAYEGYGPIGEPSFTSCTDKGADTVDYIFYSWEMFKLLEVLSIPEFEDLEGTDPRQITMEGDPMYDAMECWVDDASGLSSYKSLQTIKTFNSYRSSTDNSRSSSTVASKRTNVQGGNLQMYMGEWVPFITENSFRIQHLLPNSVYPSDHLAIKAVFEFIKPQLPTSWC